MEQTPTLEFISIFHLKKIPTVEALLTEILQYVVPKYEDYVLDLHVIYEVLSGKDITYYSSHIIRSKKFVGYLHSVISDLKSWANDIGEIYAPSNPLSLNIARASLRYTKEKLELLGLSYRNKPAFIYNKELIGIYTVKSFIEGIYLFKNDKYPGATSYITFPKKLLKHGISTIKQLCSLSEEEQVHYLNMLNKYLQNKKIILFKNRDEAISFYSQDGTENSKRHLCFCKDTAGYTLLIPSKITKLNLQSREIISRHVEYVSDVIYVFYDTEWTWHETSGGEDASMHTEKPQVVSYIVVNGASISANDLSAIYSAETVILRGEDPILDFLHKLISISFLYKNKKIYAISHNGAQIEHHFIIGGITRWFADVPNYQLHFSHVQGTKIMSFRWRTIEFRDSLLFIPGSLKSICEALNTKNKKLEIENIETIDWTQPTEAQLEYAKMDSLCLAEACVKFTFYILEATKTMQLINLFSFKSISSFVKHWLVKDSDFGWDSEHLLMLRNLVYFGGRVECFFIGDQDKFKRSYGLDNAFSIKIDVTSSYPYSMSRDALPNRVEKAEEICFKDIKFEDRENKIYLLLFNPKYSAEQKIPLLPHKLDSKLLFPNLMSGSISCFVWDFEFEQLKLANKPEDKVTMLTLSKSFCMCEKIKHLFDYRKAAKSELNEGLSYVLKILMNSGYGSLGLNPEREISYLCKGTYVEKNSRSKTNVSQIPGPNGFVWINYKEFTEVNTLMLCAAYITSYSRFILWKELMRLVEEEDAIPIYCDTDSVIFVDKEGKEGYYRKRYVGSELGSWKYEGSAKTWEIKGLKVYRFGEEVKYKGISGDFLLDGAGRIVDKINMEIWSRGREGRLEVYTVEKKMTGEYTKGFVMPDGIVRPLIL